MKAFSAAVIAVAALVALTGCAAEHAVEPVEPAAKPKAAPSAVPLPELKIGQPAAIDLFGNGQATVTVVTTELSKSDSGQDRLVVTIDILLKKAGKPVTGGPENFRFRDKDLVMHNAQTSEESFPPRLPSATFATAGQATHGRLFFDVPTGSVTGGHIQLMTGALVHAVWAV